MVETICAQEAAIGPCERALKCPQGAMKIQSICGSREGMGV